MLSLDAWIDERIAPLGAPLGGELEATSAAPTPDASVEGNGGVLGQSRVAHMEINENKETVETVKNKFSGDLV